MTRLKTTWIPRSEVRRVVTHEEPNVATAMEELASASPEELVRRLSPLTGAYGAWVEQQANIDLDSEARMARRKTLLRDAAHANERIRAGIELLGRDVEVRESFQLMNRAMAMAARKRSPQRYTEDKPGPSWRLFQLAFVLLSLVGIADDKHPDREEVELIFFPTGGGKTEAYLGVIGFRSYADDVAAVLRKLDRPGALAAVRVAIAERTHRPPPRIDLVWTGPETKASTAHDTALAVERLFGEAKHTVIVAGYSFDTPSIVAPLHRAMKERGVTVTLFLDIAGHADTAAGAEAYASKQIDRFFQNVWTFGLPKPDVYYDPRTAAPGPPWASLHAKCVIVDDEKAFITSANFTDRGQSRNIEVGVLIEDMHFAEQLASHWRQLIGDGLVHRYMVSGGPKN